MGILEIIVFLIVVLIVIPPDHLPEVMRAVGKILRELRIASNTVVRELSGVLEEPYYMREQNPERQRSEGGATSASPESPEASRQP